MIGENGHARTPTPAAGQLWMWCEEVPGQKTLTVTFACDLGPTGLIGAERRYVLLRFDDDGLKSAEVAGPSPPHGLAQLIDRALPCRTPGCASSRGHDGACEGPGPPRLVTP